MSSEEKMLRHDVKATHNTLSKAPLGGVARIRGSLLNASVPNISKEKPTMSKENWNSLSNPARIKMLGRVISALVKQCAPEDRSVALTVAQLDNAPDLGLVFEQRDGKPVIVLALGDDVK